MGTYEGKRHLIALRARQAKAIFELAREYAAVLPKRQVIATSLLVAADVLVVLSQIIEPGELEAAELADAHYPSEADAPFCDVPGCNFPHNQPCQWCEATEGTTPKMHRDGRTYHRCNECGEPNNG